MWLQWVTKVSCLIDGCHCEFDCCDYLFVVILFVIVNVIYSCNISLRSKESLNFKKPLVSLHFSYILANDTTPQQINNNRNYNRSTPTKYHSCELFIVFIDCIGFRLHWFQVSLVSAFIVSLVSLVAFGAFVSFIPFFDLFLYRIHL